MLVARPDPHHVAEPLIAPLQGEPVVPAGLDRHGQHHPRTVRSGLVDDLLAVLLVHEHPGPAGRQPRSITSTPLPY